MNIQLKNYLKNKLYSKIKWLIRKYLKLLKMNQFKKVGPRKETEPVVKEPKQRVSKFSSEEERKHIINYTLRHTGKTN